jgi:hypothetical protein
MDTKRAKYISKRFENKFPNDDACLELLKKYRFPTGIKCATCKKVTKHYKIAKQPCYNCDICGREVYPTAGTIFHKSTIPLMIWFEAMFWVVTVSNGLSAKELQRRTGMAYSTAWRMLNKILTLPPKYKGLFTAIDIEVGGTPGTLKPIIKDIAKRLIPPAAIRLGIPAKEVQKRLSINFLRTNLSKEINAYVKPSTFSITISEALMIFYHKMLKVFVSTLDVGYINTQIVEKRKFPPGRILKECKKLLQAYSENKLFEEGAFLLEELTEGQSIVLSYLVDSCEYFAVAHELGHIITMQTKGKIGEYSLAKDTVEEFLSKIPDLGKKDKLMLIKPWTNEICADLTGLQLSLSQSPTKRNKHGYDNKQWFSSGAQIALLLNFMLQEYEDRLNNGRKVSFDSTHPHDSLRVVAIRKRAKELHSLGPYDVGKIFGHFVVGMLDDIFVKTESGDYTLRNPK